MLDDVTTWCHSNVDRFVEKIIFWLVKEYFSVYTESDKWIFILQVILMLSDEGPWESSDKSYPVEDKEDGTDPICNQ